MPFFLWASAIILPHCGGICHHQKQHIPAIICWLYILYYFMISSHLNPLNLKWVLFASARTCVRSFSASRKNKKRPSSRSSRSFDLKPVETNHHFWFAICFYQYFYQLFFWNQFWSVLLANVPLFETMVKVSQRRIQGTSRWEECGSNLVPFCTATLNLQH